MAYSKRLRICGIAKDLIIPQASVHRILKQYLSQEKGLLRGRLRARKYAKNQKEDQLKEKSVYRLIRTVQGRRKEN